MPEIVTFTIARDDHACLVDAALVALGAVSHLICQTALPGHGDVSVSPDQSHRLVFGESEFRLEDITAFWNRRRASAFAIPAAAHPADGLHIEQNWMATLEGAAVLLDEQFSVNSLAAAAATSSKLNQLRWARPCGLIPPPSLVSNDLDEIIRFGETAGVLCVKPLSVFTWLTGESEVRTLTTTVANPRALNADSVGLMPAIYQTRIQKAYEVRITLFGAVVIATRINLPEDAEDQHDYRVDNGYLTRLEPIVAPAALVENCRLLMRRLCLRFGSFDFIVTPSGSWVFLEVNESGQFIWQEQFCPDQPVIEPFARFLAAADPAFDWGREQCSGSLGFEGLAREIKSNRRYNDIRSGPVPTRSTSLAMETARPPPEPRQAMLKQT